MPRAITCAPICSAIFLLQFSHEKKDALHCWKIFHRRCSPLTRMWQRRSRRESSMTVFACNFATVLRQQSCRTFRRMDTTSFITNRRSVEASPYVRRPDCRHFQIITFSKGLERSNTNKSAMQFRHCWRGKLRKSSRSCWREIISNRERGQPSSLASLRVSFHNVSGFSVSYSQITMDRQPSFLSAA